MPEYNDFENSVIRGNSLDLWLGDTVKERGNFYETGIVTGVVSSEDNHVRVYWNSTNDLRHETIHISLLERVI
jgi:hypothetical protein